MPSSTPDRPHMPYQVAAGSPPTGNLGRRPFLLGAAAITTMGLMTMAQRPAGARSAPLLRPAPAEPGSETCAALHPTTGLATLVSPSFQIGIDHVSGGVHALRNNGDTGYCTNYVLTPDSHPAFDIDDSRWLGDVVLRVDGTPRVTSLSDDIREVVRLDDDTIEVRYRGDSMHRFGIRGFDLVQTYRLGGEDGDVLEWTTVLTNTGTDTITRGSRIPTSHGRLVGWRRPDRDL